MIRNIHMLWVLSVKIGFETVADMVMHFLADTLLPKRRFDNDGMCTVIDPCTNPEALRTFVDNEMENGRFSIFGIAMLDLADQETYESLMQALGDWREHFVEEMPCIDF
jgi:hypothetical protein